MREGVGKHNLSGIPSPGGDPMWRSLDELAGTPQFREAMHREFPAAMWDFDQSEASRRTFLRLMGASLALAGLYGCSERPSEKIVPYVQQPEQIVPGTPLFFATAMPMNGLGYGVLAESHEGRPTKIEGNPKHPASLGASNIFMQASALLLYDPDDIRAKNVQRLGSVGSWDDFQSELSLRLNAKKSTGGKGVRLLTGTVTSPSLIHQIEQFLKRFPQAKWHHFDPMARVNTQQGAMLAFSRPLNTVHRFRRFDEEKTPIDARVIVSLDSDFLWADPGSLQYARHFAAARKVRVRHWWQTTMSRLYVIESTLSLTGSMADHRVPARPKDVALFAEALADLLGAEHSSRNIPVEWSKQLDAIVSDLNANKGQSIVIAGESQPREVHRLVHAINAALGNVGKTIYYTEPVESFPTGSGNKPITALDSLRELVADMNQGNVDTLLILGENPVYTAPADLKFGDALFRLSQSGATERAGNFTAYLGLYSDETAYLCQWQLPQAHYLESWGDVRAFDGTGSLIQPLISPMFEGRSANEVMAMALEPASPAKVETGYEIIRGYWRSQVKGDFDDWWKKTLETGVIEGSQFKPVEAPQIAANSQAHGREAVADSDFEIVLRPDPSVWDGAFGNSGWLQECPKFFTKLVWDNAALISAGTSELLRKKFGAIDDGDVFRFHTADGLTVDAPILVLPGVPDHVVVMHLGYGRTRGGAATMEHDDVTPRGFNAYQIRHSNSPWTVRGVTIEKTDKFHELVVTHNHHAMDTLPRYGRADESGDLRPKTIEHPTDDPAEKQDDEINNRKLIRTATLAYFNARPENRHFVKELGGDAEKKPLLSIYPGWDYSQGYQWGMSIDLQSCIGCNACLVACVAENNIAVVGRDEVQREREMHWIRIDQYFADDLDNPKIYHQPVPCMHCETAPCEVVCPVGATVHSPEGLNEMVYNRCVGTRYCSNNCPYKVRRFNFFNWFHDTPPGYDLQHNPEVTVRSRGVMEKCTYCIQRLERTRIEIEKSIVRLEELIRQLQEQRTTSPADGLANLDTRIAKLQEQRGSIEFDTLERLQTACQQSCPTEAIAFGNILPMTVAKQGQEQTRLTQVTKLKQEPLDYPLLAELTTKPRTTYLARLRNPNPQLEPDATS